MSKLSEHVCWTCLLQVANANATSSGHAWRSTNVCNIIQV
jgi:hypothetical protein